MSPIRVREVMKPPAVRVFPWSPLDEVVETLLGNKLSGVPVTDEDGRLLGMVTMADLIVKFAATTDAPRLTLFWSGFRDRAMAGRLRRLDGVTASDAMTRDLVTASEDEPAHDAALRILDEGLNRLPVVRGDRLVGVIGREDLLAVFARSDTDLMEEIEKLLSYMGRADIGVQVAHGVARLSGHVCGTEEARTLKHAVRATPGLLGVDVTALLGCETAEAAAPFAAGPGRVPR